MRSRPGHFVDLRLKQRVKQVPAGTRGGWRWGFPRGGTWGAPRGSPRLAERGLGRPARAGAGGNGSGGPAPALPLRALNRLREDL